MRNQLKLLVKKDLENRVKYFLHKHQIIQEIVLHTFYRRRLLRRLPLRLLRLRQVVQHHEFYCFQPILA